MLEIAAITYIDIAPVLPVAGLLPEEGGSIGRGEGNAVVLPDPMRLLSRRHLLVKPDGKGGHVLTNISASNTALLNDLPVAPGESRAVSHGDQIRIGGYLLELRVSGEGTEGARPSPAGKSTGEKLPDNLPERLGSAEPDEADTLEALLGGVESPAVTEKLPGSLPERLHSAEPDEADTLEALLGGMEPSDAVPPAAAEADIERILDIGGTRALMSDDPLGISSVQETVRLSDLAGDDRKLLRGLDQASRPGDLARELTQDPLTENNNPFLEEGTLDPLEIFAGEAVRMRNLFGTPDKKSSGFIGTTPSRPVNELHSPISLDLHGASTHEAAPAAIGPIPELLAGVEDRAVEGEEVRTAEAGSAPLIPDDFLLDDLLGGPPAIPPCSDVPEAGVSLPEGDGCYGDSQPVPALPRQPAGLSPTHPAPSVAEAPPDATEPSGQENGSGPASTPPAGAETGPEEKTDQEAAALHAALLEGLALDVLPEHRTLDADFMRKLGTLLRTAIDGTIRLMAARATVKREVRAHVTVISPERNNPLKFSPDADVALLYLLGREYPGFMNAEEAVQEAFTDLLSHQAGMISGMRAALSVVLERFDPETISRNADTRGMIDSLLSVGRKARLWDAYGRYFEDTREQAVDRFQDFFGAAFVDAYEGRARTDARQEHEAP